jgi:hypothetical protein
MPPVFCMAPILSHVCFSSLRLTGVSSLDFLQNEKASVANLTPILEKTV